MELHSSVSVEKELQHSAVFGNANGGRMSCWMPEQEGVVAKSSSDQPLVKAPSREEAPSQQQQHQSELQQEADGNDSTGSPRSFDSQSSIGV